MTISRRSFLGSSAAAIITAGAASRNSVWGANDRIAHAVVGFNGQGRSHINDILKESDAEIVALCDVDSNVMKRGVDIIQKATGKTPKTYHDIREMLADPSIDSISIATPNHWHSLMAIWGVQAGKDVYVEKPMAHSAYEGRQVVAASNKYDRIIQHGTQSRADAELIRDMKLLHSGFIGKVIHSRGVVYKNGNRNPIGHGKPGPVPDYLDWTLWQGPAKDKPFMINVDREKPGLYVHYDWHWFWEYGNGEIGNQGVHQMDIACWAHNRGKPAKVTSTGGRFGWDDDGETPNTQATQFTYPDGSLLTFEVRNLGSFYEGGPEAGASTNSAFGETGYWIHRRGFFDYKNKPIEVTEPAPEDLGRFRRFFNAVRSRKKSDVPVTVEDAHLACLLCQLGNVAYRVGQTLFFDGETETFVNSEEGDRMMKRDYREGFEVPDLA
ncbi:MAG: Gfo/Idh/MocA family oxidoreductase [Acidobacteriota bacterium]|nr:MAG: Gfo/Idh/MocA family oxidoreductase [Acidobacteriota bacterium]